jgi:membrane-bound serine protease (ClpP class)
MVELGATLVLIGVILVVAEAHVPGGVLGVAGGVALIIGGILAIGALGGGAALAVPVGLGLGAAAGGWALLVTNKAAGARRARIQAGSEALCGRIGIVRGWSGPAGQVFVDGALWRARHVYGAAGEESLHEGDPVVVEHVNGLTLSVRRADEWELIA